MLPLESGTPPWDHASSEELQTASEIFRGPWVDSSLPSKRLKLLIVLTLCRTCAVNKAEEMWHALASIGWLEKLPGYPPP